MTLALQGDGPTAEDFIAVGRQQLRIAGIPFVELRQVIYQYRIAVDDMSDHLAAPDFHFRSHPFLTPEGTGRGGDAMVQDQPAVHHDVGAGGAYVQRGTLPLGIAPQELHFDGDRKILVHLHAFGRLTVNHHAAVPVGPSCTARTLFSHKAIFHSQQVMRKGILVKNMPIAVPKAVVGIVPHLHHSVFDAESIPEILPGFIALDLYRPPRKVPPVKKRDPLTLRSCFRGATRDSPGYHQEEAPHQVLHDLLHSTRFFIVLGVEDSCFCDLECCPSYE